MIAWKDFDQDSRMSQGKADWAPVHQEASVVGILTSPFLSFVLSFIDSERWLYQ